MADAIVDNYVSEEESSGSLKAYKTLGQISEIASVLLLSSGLLWLYFTYSSKPKPPEERGVWSWLLPIFLLILASLAFLAARRYSILCAEATAQLARKIRYRVTERRIETLRQVKPDMDVLNYLQTIVSYDVAMTENEFLLKLESALGPARANQVKADVFRYTRIYEPSEAPATVAPAPSPTTPKTETELPAQ